MISYPRPATRAQLLDYFVKESQGYNSFVEHPEFRPEFGGSLCEKLGLKPGPFTEDEYTAFCLGEFPAVVDGRLKIKYSPKDSERAAYDVTVTTPKDFGLQLLVSGDTRLFEVAREMNKAVMNLFQEYAIVRATDERGIVRKVPAQGIAYATWWHISTRERKRDVKSGIGAGAGPHFHAHNLVSKFVLPRGHETLMGIIGKDIQIAARSAKSVDAGKIGRQAKRMSKAQKEI